MTSHKDFTLGYGNLIIGGAFWPLDPKDRRLLTTIPSITYPRNDVLYTLVMLDPDVPNGMDHDGNSPYLHWWISNANSGGADTWVQYVPPTPPRGTHRYIFYLFEQQGEVSHVPVAGFPTTRDNFDIHRWTRIFGLKPDYTNIRGFLLDADKN